MILTCFFSLTALLGYDLHTITIHPFNVHTIVFITYANYLFLKTLYNTKDIIFKEENTT